MAKRLPLLVSIILLFVLASSCKNPVLNLEFYLFEAEGSYALNENVSYLKLNAWVKINQSTVNINPAYSLDPTHFVNASVKDWEFLIYEGENLIIELNNNNINTVFNNIYLNTASDQYDYLWVSVVSEELIPGDIYEGKYPDSVEVRMVVTDDNGEVYYYSKTVPFVFERK